MSVHNERFRWVRTELIVEGRSNDLFERCFNGVIEHVAIAEGDTHLETLIDVQCTYSEC